MPAADLQAPAQAAQAARGSERGLAPPAAEESHSRRANGESLSPTWLHTDILHHNSTGFPILPDSDITANSVALIDKSTISIPYPNVLLGTATDQRHSTSRHLAVSVRLTFLVGIGQRVSAGAEFSARTSACH